MTYRRHFKPVLDCTAALCGLVLLSPALLALAILIPVKLGAPILFRQRRIGKDDAPFLFVKFRSMTDERDASGDLLPDAVRLTHFGRFLRSSSLDELPQLWNVLRGEMSLIGPRPLLPEYLPRYSPTQRRRHEVKPGITGLAQINGRNAIDWDTKFAWDILYVDSLSFALDMRILWTTVAAVFQRRNISREGHATAPAFLGPASSSSPSPPDANAR